MWREGQTNPSISYVRYREICKTATAKSTREWVIELGQCWQMLVLSVHVFNQDQRPKTSVLDFLSSSCMCGWIPSSPIWRTSQLQLGNIVFVASQTLFYCHYHNVSKFKTLSSCDLFRCQQNLLLDPILITSTWFNSHLSVLQWCLAKQWKMEKSLSQHLFNPAPLVSFNSSQKKHIVHVCTVRQIIFFVVRSPSVPLLELYC